MTASATANSGESVASPGSYSPTHNDDTAIAVSRPARSWRKRRKSASLAANVRSALKLSITMMPGRCCLIKASMRSETAASPS